jgi:hypothetical protein
MAEVDTSQGRAKPTGLASGRRVPTFAASAWARCAKSGLPPTSAVEAHRNRQQRISMRVPMPTPYHAAAAAEAEANWRPPAPARILPESLAAPCMSHRVSEDGSSQPSESDRLAVSHHRIWRRSIPFRVESRRRRILKKLPLVQWVARISRKPVCRWPSFVHIGKYATQKIF